MQAVITIAQSVFRDSIRDRVLLVIVLFTLSFIGSAWFIAELSIRDQQKLLYDMGLATVALFSMVTTIFLSANLLFKETDKGTIHIILSKPITRAQFIWGKWLGIVFTVSILTVLMTLVFCGFLLLHGEPVVQQITQATILLLAETAFISALALLISSVASPLIATGGTLIIVLLGHAMFSIQEIIYWTSTTPAMRVLATLITTIGPNLDVLNIREEIVHDIAVTYSQVGWSLMYIGGYTALLLLASGFLFQRKNF